jgi:hypothetical protein
MDNVPPHILSKTDIDSLNMDIRDRRIYLKKVTGKSNIIIGEEEGMSAQNVQRILKKYLAKLDDEDKEMFRNIIIERLEKLYENLDKKCIGSERPWKKTKTILLVQDQLSRLLGLYKSSVDVTSNGEKISIIGVDLTKI